MTTETSDNMVQAFMMGIRCGNMLSNPGDKEEVLGLLSSIRDGTVTLSPSAAEIAPPIFQKFALELIRNAQPGQRQTAGQILDGINRIWPDN